LLQPVFRRPIFSSKLIKTPQMYAIPTVKPPHTFRIFVLGESAAMGDPDPSYGFSRYLEVMLRESYPGTNFEIVNTGSVAINSRKGTTSSFDSGPPKASTKMAS
jgi:hypothetical protein